MENKFKIKTLRYPSIKREKATVIGKRAHETAFGRVYGDPNDDYFSAIVGGSKKKLVVK